MSAHKTVVLNVVGLTPRALYMGETPQMWERFVRDDAENAENDEETVRTIAPTMPAVTCTAQATYLTGRTDHGIVGNGWFDHDDQEVKFWKQSNKLVRAEQIWTTIKARDPTATTCNMFWWYNMYNADADFAVTPRPQYRTGGAKASDVHTHPASLRDVLQTELGTFPLQHFWGPYANIESSKWIARASKRVDEMHDPTFTTVYLPHLDYAFQKYGPASDEARAALRELDLIVADLTDFYVARGARVVLLSEYGIVDVRRRIDINRVLGEDYVSVRHESGYEMLDAGASRAFAVADHQVAHVYVRDPLDVPDVRALLESIQGVEVRDAVPDGDTHRAGTLLAIAPPDAWFSYYYWHESPPCFADTIDIHRKPGYDPLEMFVSPNVRFPRVYLAWKLLLQKALGMNIPLRVIATDEESENDERTAVRVRGSHGRDDALPRDCPVLLAHASTRSLVSSAAPPTPVPSTGVRDVLLHVVFAAA